MPPRLGAQREQQLFQEFRNFWNGGTPKKPAVTADAYAKDCMSDTRSTKVAYRAQDVGVERTTPRQRELRAIMRAAIAEELRELYRCQKDAALPERFTQSFATLFGDEIMHNVHAHRPTYDIADFHEAF